MKCTRRLAALLLLILAFAMSLPLTALAAETPEITDNSGAHNYVNGGRWAAPAKSGLTYDAASGVYTRVECKGDAVVVETYSSGFAFTGSRTIALELPIYGGFYAGENYNFLIFGQKNAEESDSAEVIRVVKFDKNWNRLGQASLYGANTTVPFRAGSLSAAEYNGYLYIRTSHEMYTSDDGLNHQANLTMNVRISDMVITDSFYDVMSNSYGYVSHSFCQFIAVDETEKKVVAADHGDAYPRAVMLTKYCAPAGQDSFLEQVRVDLGGGYYTWKYADAADVLPIVGNIGDNDTGVSLGGFAISNDAYLTVGNTVSQTETGFDLRAQRNIFVTVTDKDLANTEVVMLTDYTDSDDVTISNPYIVRIDGGRLLVLWMEDSTLCYTFLNSTGAAGKTYRFEIKGSFPDCLSDCQPIVAGDRVVWYVTASSKPVFFSIDLNDPSALTETHNYVSDVCNVCGYDISDPGSGDSQENPGGDQNDGGDDGGEQQGVIRLAGGNRWDTSLMVAEEMKDKLNVEKFDAIIIASGNDFADALAGSYLSTVKSAPILLSWGKGGNYAYLDTDNIDYIKENLAENGTVYILGGTSAVPELYEQALSGITVKRLGGANRFETNLLILEEAGVNAGDEILVCTSTNFADSLSASATGKPILLVFNEMGKLYGRQPEYLGALKNCTFTVIGGESAVCAELENAVRTYGATTRLAGSNRFVTSVLVAEKYFEDPDSAVLAYAWNYPDGLCGGALAYSMDAPLILTMTCYEAEADAYISAHGITNGVVLGGTGLISEESVDAIFGGGTTGHRYSSTVVEPTTSAGGYTLHTCAKCGHTYKDNYTEKLVDESWKEDYLGFINWDLRSFDREENADIFAYTRYYLIWLDEDEVPEVWIEYPFSAMGSILMTKLDDGAAFWRLSMGGLSYYEYENIFHYSNGKQGYYADYILSIEGDSLMTHAEGTKNATDMTWENFDYTWNGETVTGEAYAQAIADYVDPDTAINMHTDVEAYTYDEIVEFLSN